jgi:hypothetical protein
MKYHIIWYGAIIPEWYQQKIDAMKSFVESKGHEFVFLYFPEFSGTPRDATIAKDRLQFTMACSTPDGAFIDADCDLFAIPVLLPGKPYFERLPPNRPHNGYVIVNNCCQYFTDLIAEHLPIWDRCTRDSVHGFTNKMLRGKKNEVYYIEDSSYKHMFPARAGMNRCATLPDRCANYVPRTRGDEPCPISQ